MVPQECKPTLKYKNLYMMENYGWSDFKESVNVSSIDLRHSGSHFGINPFYIENGIFIVFFSLYIHLYVRKCIMSLTIV